MRERAGILSMVCAELARQILIVWKAIFFSKKDCI